jgi:hypothetical protein
MFSRDIKEETWNFRLGKGSRDECVPFRWDQLHVDTEARQVQTQRVGSERGVFGPIGSGSFRRFRIDLPTEWKEGRVAVVAQPWAELMGRAKPLDTPLAGLKHPGRVGGGLQRPVSHPEWKSGNGKRIAT